MSRKLILLFEDESILSQYEDNKVEINPNLIYLLKTKILKKIYLSIYLLICLSIYRHTYLPIHLSIVLNNLIICPMIRQ